MKSLLVAKQVRTTAITTQAPLAKGDLLIKSINGIYVQTTPALVSGVWKAKGLGSSTANDTTVGSPIYRYVVALGDGNFIEGLWLNAENKVYTKQSYDPGARKSVTIASIAFDPIIATDAEIHIQTQPKSSLSGLDYQEFVAVVPVTSTTRTTAQIEAALIVKLTQLVKDINKYFGKNVITPITEGENAPETLVNLALTAVDTDFNFYITFGGNATGKTTESNTLTFGTQAEVIELEKEMAIATFGYNPNFEAGDKAYGNVLLASEFGASGYDIHVVASVAPATDQMPLHPDGAKVEQWIALPTGNTTLA